MIVRAGNDKVVIVEKSSTFPGYAFWNMQDFPVANLCLRDFVKVIK